MTVITEMIMYCVVCGAAIYPRGEFGRVDWLNEVILLHTKDGRDEFFELQELPANNKGGPYFILDSGEEVAACDSPDIGQTYPALYFPCHTACLKITKVAISLIKGDDLLPVRSMQHLWKVLLTQWKRVIDEHGWSQPHTNLWHAANYGDIRLYQQIEEENEQRFEIFETNPMNIPQLTAHLISFLRPFSHTRSEQPLINVEPDPETDFLTIIMEQLNWLHEPSLECTYTIHPTDWLRCSLKYAILPWFWDLDFGMLRRKEAEKDKGAEWDWELWVRQLAQPEICEPGKVVQDISLAVRNRRRIWRLIEDLLSQSPKYTPPEKLYVLYSQFGEDE